MLAAVAEVAAVDWSTVGDDDLHDATVALTGVSSQVTSAAAPAVQEWRNRRVWADGSRSPQARLARDARCAPATAGRACTLAEKLTLMPLTAAAFAEGRIHHDHAWRLAVARTPHRAALFTAAEATLVASATDDDFDTFLQAVQYFETTADDLTDTATGRHAQRHAGRRAHHSRTYAGTWKLDATFDITGGEIFDTALDRIYNELLEADWAALRAEHGDAASPSQLPRTAAQRRCDALVEMAIRATATPPDGHRPRPLITVLVGYEELAGPIRETINGNVMARHDIADLLDDADIERAVFRPKNRIIELSETARFFTGGLRRLIELRDRRCTHPGCDIPAERCQVDHIIEHTDGGPTTADNGRLLCRYHNRRRPGRRTTTPTNPTDDDPHKPTDPE